MTTFSQVSALHVNVEPDPCNPMCFANVLAHRVYGTKFESMHQAIESMHQAIESMHQAIESMHQAIESIGIRRYTGDHFYLTLLHFTYFFNLSVAIPFFLCFFESRVYRFESIGQKSSLCTQSESMGPDSSLWAGQSSLWEDCIDSFRIRGYTRIDSNSKLKTNLCRQL